MSLTFVVESITAVSTLIAAEFVNALLIFSWPSELQCRDFLANMRNFFDIHCIVRRYPDFRHGIYFFLQVIRVFIIKAERLLANYKETKNK